jgi:hypothetical protein
MTYSYATFGSGQRTVEKLSISPSLRSPAAPTMKVFGKV